MTIFRVARTMSGALAICLLVTTAIVIAKTAVFVANAQSTTGTVDASAVWQTADGESHYSPFVVFFVSGEKYAVVPESLLSNFSGRIGTSVTLLFDPDDPQ